MKRYFKYIKEDRLIFRIYVLAFILIAVTIIFILLNYTKLPPLLPIFNQLPWGERRLSITPGIFIPSIVVLSVLLINILTSAIAYTISPLISRILAITSFLTALLTLLFIIRTIRLII